MILIKVILTIAIVTTLSIVAERVSPRVAGILSGYPLGSAIALFFIGLEQGARFAGTSAIYNIAGLAAQVSAYFIYYLVSRQVKKWGLLAAAPAMIAAFLLVDGLIHSLTEAAPIPLPAWASALIGAGAILACGVLYRIIPAARISQKIHLGPGVLLFRAGLAALTILVITGAAGLVPPSWAGLFTAFPTASFPLVLIIHATYGPEQTHAIIKSIPTGLWSLVLYSLAISAAYPRLGIYWGTLVGFGVATIYLMALAGINRIKETS